jgi:cell division protein FtsW
LGATLALLALGTITVYSASAIPAQRKMGYGEYFLFRHLASIAVGAIALYVGARVDFAHWRKLAYPGLLVALLLLVAVLLVGSRVSGATRWFRVGPLSFQPSDGAKIALLWYLAHTLSKKADKVRLFSVGFLPPLCVAGVMVALVLREPDLGTAALLGGTALAMLFVAGAKIPYLLLAVLAAAPVAWHAIVGTPWRLRRMLAFLDPWQYRQDVGYQITESLISVGSGGVFGLGLGDGKQKLFFLPEAHTDFIAATVGEELGLVGLAGLVVAFGLLVARGLRAAIGARDAFGTYLAAGISAVFGLQASVNLAVVLGALPTKGLTLPFVSFGGSAMVSSLFLVGMLLNISRRAPAPVRKPVTVRRTTGARRLAPQPGRVVVVEP